MIVQETEIEREKRLQEESEQRNFYLADERAKEENQRRLKKIDVSVKKATYRADAVVSVLKYIVKFPVLLILAIFVPVIILAGKEVPEFLQDMFE